MQKRIILVEDDLELADLTASYLAGNGYDMTIVSDGRTAVDTRRDITRAGDSSDVSEDCTGSRAHLAADGDDTALVQPQVLYLPGVGNTSRWCYHHPAANGVG